MELRNYQLKAVESVYDHIRTREDNPLVVIPTGGGKTPVIATICRDAVLTWSGRVLVLAHVKELLEQTHGKLQSIAPDLEVGIYSAGLGRRDLTAPVTVAGIQSIWQRAGELGPVDLVIVDEAHLIPPDEDEGMYRSFLADARLVNPNLRVIGLTATPFRMRTGMICSPEGILNHVCYEIGVRDLIEMGYLSPLKSKAGVARVDMSALRMRAGDFIESDVQDLFDTDDLVESACAEIARETASRRSVLIFAAGIAHGTHVARVLKDRHGIECGFVHGKTPSGERDRLITEFKAGRLKCLANMNVLTTGFDAPNVDCVVLLRPTASPGLYYQMVGRGFRLAPGKEDCLVLDFGGNVLRHGPVDEIEVPDRPNSGRAAPMKECPECHALIPAATLECAECGHTFDPPDRQMHASTATTASILSDGRPKGRTEVISVSFREHYKRSDPMAPPTMRVDYEIGLGHYVSEWVCLEHPEGSYPHERAAEWWAMRSDQPMPATVQEAVALANEGALAPTLSIHLSRKANSPFDKVSGHILGAKPSTTPPDDGIPF
jgi:DNA repair protein RadD